MRIVRQEWYGKRVIGAVRKQAAEALIDGAEHILEHANRTVPHDQGILQSTGQADVDENSLTAAVSYDTPYARRLHEHPEYNFQKGRRGKWLELTIQERAPAMREFFAGKLRMVFR